MQKIRIYIIASVSSLFIGVSVGLMVSEVEAIKGWALLMGLMAALGGMMIELTVPETLIITWKQSSKVYRFLAVLATIASPILLIWALPGYGIARFSVAFIVASLITYLSFYAMEHIKSEVQEDKLTQREREARETREREIRLKAELKLEEEKIKAELEITKQKTLAIEDRKTQKALARIQNQGVLPLSREAVIELIKTEPSISQRELGRRFGKAPQTVMKLIQDLVDNGTVSNGSNGSGISFLY